MIKKIILLFLLILVFIFSLSYFILVKNNPFRFRSHLNFVILGLDPRDDDFEKTNTTDTIMFASLNLQNQQLSLISLPRDLWFYPISSKINQIYPQSLLADQPDFKFIQTNFSDLTGQTIDRTITLTTRDLIDFISLIGGVEVNLSQGFVDTEFPNPDYIKNPSPNIPVYITVSFPTGPVTLDESNIAYFVRSRKGSDSNDLDRIERQQLLIEAVFQKIQSPQFYQNLQNLENLYNFYRFHLKTNLSFHDLLMLSVKLNTKISNLTLQKISIPAGDNPQTDLLYYPGRLFEGQWVFLPQDEKYQGLHQFVRESLK